jgi:hypothetical protein
MIINNHIKPEDLQEKLDLFWKLSGDKILKIESEYDTTKGAPVFTVTENIPHAAGPNGHRGFNMAQLFCSSMPLAMSNS